MIELECELIFLQRYNLNQHKSTINHILTKKRALKRYVLPRPNFSQGKNNQLTKVTNNLQVASSHLCAIGNYFPTN